MIDGSPNVRVAPLLGHASGADEVIIGELRDRTHASANAATMVVIGGARHELLRREGEQVARVDGDMALHRCGGSERPARPAVALKGRGW